MKFTDIWIFQKNMVIFTTFSQSTFEIENFFEENDMTI